MAFDNAAHAADAEALFKKTLLEIPCIISLDLPNPLVRLAANCLRRSVPSCYRVLEIRVIGQVTADRRMVAEFLVLDGWLSGSNRVEEICLVSRNIAVPKRCRKRFCFLHLVIERPRLRMFRFPLRQIFLAQPFWPALGRICFGLRTYI